MANNFTSKNISSISLENIIYNLKSVPFHATAAEWELAPLNAYVPKQGEIVVYDKDENHDYIRIKIGDGINNPNGLDFYAGSWNDLVDKPFGETTVKGDTLTWDGNTDGLVSVDTGDSKLYLVADNVITAEELKGGLTAVDSYGDSYTAEYSEVEEAMALFGGALPLAEGNGYIIPTDNFVFMESITFPNAGIYFCSGEYGSLVSLTIPGYNGFETTTIQTIETKYLPEHLQFGGVETKVVESDTLTWDGDLAGKVVVLVGDASYVHISDATITEEDIPSEYTAKTDLYGEDVFTEVTQPIDGIFSFADDGIWYVREDNFDTGIGVIFPKKGFYFVRNEDFYFTSLTIPGYKGFVSEQTVVTPIDEKYLPESIATISYIDEAIAAIDIPDVSNFITESELNEAVGGLGSAAFTETTDYMLAGQVIDGGAW